jgi:hypothetical protein
LRSSVVSCQHFAVRLINWLTTQVKLFRKSYIITSFYVKQLILAPLATIVGNVLLHDCSIFCRLNADDDEEVLIPTVDYDTGCISPTCGHKSPCTCLVLADRSLWKAARLSCHQLMMSTILMHLEQKRNFGRLLIEVSFKLEF